MSTAEEDDRDLPEEETAGKHAHGGRRSLPEGAERHPLIDLSRDPNPGRPDHAKPDEE